jgi:hypothetical protein
MGNPEAEVDRGDGETWIRRAIANYKYDQLVGKSRYRTSSFRLR